MGVRARHRASKRRRRGDDRAGELGLAPHPAREPMPEQAVHLDAVVAQPARRRRGGGSARSPRAPERVSLFLFPYGQLV